MSGQGVDVLAVLDYEIRTIPICTEDYGPQRAQDVRDLSEARAAVAELVEVATQIRNRCAANIAKGDYKFDNPEAKAQYGALVAALARATGASA